MNDDENTYGFDANGERVPIDFPFSDIEKEVDELPAEIWRAIYPKNMMEILNIVLKVIAGDASNMFTVGRRLTMFRFATDINQNKSQKELARILEMTPSQASKEMAKITDQLNAIIEAFKAAK